MQLLVVTLHQEELLDELLSTLVEFELPDTVVVESRSGLELLERDLPIFAGLRSLVPGGIDFCRLVLCAVEDEATAREVLAAISEVGRDRRAALGEPTNTALLVPVDEIVTF